MESHLNSLQDIVRLTIQQELRWSEQRLGRITMSYDANNKPAELYGADGKIYYRKAGGAGSELGSSASATWLGLTDTPAAFDSGKIVKSAADKIEFGISESDIARLSIDNVFTGDHQTIRGAGGSSVNRPTIVMRNSTYAAVDYPVLLVDDAGYTVLGGDGFPPKLGHPLDAANFKITDIGDPTTNGDALRYEHILADDHVQYLCVSGSRAMLGALDMGDHQLSGVDDLRAYDAIGISFKDSGNSDRIKLSPTGYAFKAFANCDMNTQKLIGLSAGSLGGESVEYDQFAAIAGTNASSFVIDQDGAGVSSQLEFERGATLNALLKWNETTNLFEFHGSSGTYGSIDVDKTYFASTSVYIDKNAGGDMELHVASGDKFKFVIG